MGLALVFPLRVCVWPCTPCMGSTRCSLSRRAAWLSNSFCKIAWYFFHMRLSCLTVLTCWILYSHSCTTKAYFVALDYRCSSLSLGLELHLCLCLDSCIYVLTQCWLERAGVTEVSLYSLHSSGFSLCKPAVFRVAMSVSSGGLLRPTVTLWNQWVFWLMMSSPLPVNEMTSASLGWPWIVWDHAGIPVLKGLPLLCDGPLTYLPSPRTV